MDRFNAVQRATQITGIIAPGNEDDLYTSYDELLSSNKRLIFLNTYSTIDATNIITTLKRMTSDEQESTKWTILQLQGTTSLSRGVGSGRQQIFLPEKDPERYHLSRSFRELIL
jgi:hypothetical protein